MQKFIFGVKSDIPANTKLTNGYTLFDWAVRKNEVPSFWTRNISGKNCLSKEEIRFLTSKKCKILLFFNDLTELEVSGSNGQPAAARAINALKEMGIPVNKNIAVLAEIKDDWTVNRNWMYSFAKELQRNGYNYGFIGNTDSSDNFSFDKEFSHEGIIGISPILYATKPEITEDIYEWVPYAPSALIPEDVHFWQNKTLNMNNVEYKTVYAREKNLPICMYEADEEVIESEC